VKQTFTQLGPPAEAVKLAGDKEWNIYGVFKGIFCFLVFKK
jgi:hypothetical protein